MNLPQNRLDHLATLDGVQAAFIFNPQGAVQAKAASLALSEERLTALASALSQTLIDLTNVQPLNSLNVDLFFDEGRLAIKGFSQGGLCIVCDRQVNNSLLNIALTECVEMLRAGLSTTAVDSDFTPVTGMKQIAEEILGEHANKVLNLLETADAEGGDLLEAIAQAEKLTRLFIDKEQAGQMARRMRDLIQ